MWACRWQRRWGARLGNLPLREAQSQAELQVKVPPQSVNSSYNSDTEM
jgi:hypothetical protein